MFFATWTRTGIRSAASSTARCIGEAGVRFAALLEQHGQEERALSIYDDVLNAADMAPKHFRTAQKAWLGTAKEGLQRLSE